jgi:hypothetical protein
LAILALSSLSRFFTPPSQQRKNFHNNNGVLYQYQIDKLSKIGFQFCLIKKPKKRLKWNDRFNEIVDYKNEHEHANPACREGELGTWCKRQRAVFQNQFSSTGKATLSQYQIDKHLPLGMRMQRANLPATPDLPDMPTLPDVIAV